jgi:hypothetical protein
MGWTTKTQMLAGSFVFFLFATVSKIALVPIKPSIQLILVSLLFERGGGVEWLKCKANSS